MLAYRAFAPADIPEALALWRATEGVGLSASDSREQLESFLARNPNLSRVAVADNQIIGTILVGHDGRRGYIHHLAVHASFRRRGIATSLVRASLSSLGEEGILKTHVFVFSNNSPAEHFWRALGWTWRDELQMFSSIQ